MRADGRTNSLDPVLNQLNDQLAVWAQNANIIEHKVQDLPSTPAGRASRCAYFEMTGITDGYNHIAQGEGAEVTPITLLDLMVVNSYGYMGTMLEAFSQMAVQQRRNANTPLTFLQTAAADSSESQTFGGGGELAMAGPGAGTAAGGQVCPSCRSCRGSLRGIRAFKEDVG